MKMVEQGTGKILMEIPEATGFDSAYCPICKEFVKPPHVCTDGTRAFRYEEATVAELQKRYPGNPTVQAIRRHRQGRA